MCSLFECGLSGVCRGSRIDDVPGLDDVRGLERRNVVRGLELRNCSFHFVQSATMSTTK
jgi:hypothetical protein